VRLFFVRAPVDRALAEQAFEPLGLASLEHLHVLTSDAANESVSGAFQVVPEKGLLLACDWDADDSIDHVMSPARSSRRLAALTLRRPARTALDLGTGCGYQALQLAAHAELVVATDSNPRALAFATFNAGLNAAPNIEFRHGDWFDTLEGLQFDLIVCNPPYVIAPATTLLYRDDGSGELSARLVRAAPRFLRDGGAAHVIVGWTHGADQHWADPLHEWVDGLGCDAWFFRETSVDPPTHAAMWNADLASQPRRYADAIERWTQALVERGIELIGDGAVVLRKRDSHPSISFDNLPSGDLADDAAADLAERLAMVEILDEMGEEDLLACRLELVPAHRLDQVLRHAVGGRAGFEAEHSTLVREDGLGSSLACNPGFVQLLAALDSQHSVDEILGDASPRFRAGALESLRYALRHGFLRFAG
jgi:hypothetical protein